MTGLWCSQWIIRTCVWLLLNQATVTRCNIQHQCEQQAHGWATYWALDRDLTVVEISDGREHWEYRMRTYGPDEIGWVAWREGLRLLPLPEVRLRRVEHRRE